MNEFIDESLLTLVTSLQGFYQHYYGSFVGVGKAIGALLCLTVVATEAYQMMLQKKGIDILALLRPVLICFVLAFWGSFTAALRQPFDSIESWARDGVYRTEVEKVKQLHIKRWETKMNQYKILQEARAKADVAKNNMEKDSNFFTEAWDSVKNAFHKAVDLLRSYREIEGTFYSWLIENVIDFLATIIWHICVLLTFFGREIALGILTITGPITWGLSVTHIWKDAWASWTTRYLSFCLYGLVAYLIMAAALQLFKYGIEVDIKRLSDPNILSSMVRFNGLYSIVAAVVGGYGLKMTPEIVSYIFPTNSSQAITHFVSGVSRAAQKAASTAAKATGL